MNTKLCIVIVLLSVVFTLHCKAQYVWKKSYSQPYASYATNVSEMYDNGYLVGGRIWENLVTQYFGYIVKTDINGNKLWQKIIDGSKTSYFQATNSTSDGGFIAGGTYNTSDSRSDAYVMKFNACAEPEWCSFLPDLIYNAPSTIWPYIYEVPNVGYFIQRTLLDGFGPQYNWSLAKLRLNGTIEWMNNYIVDNPDWYYPSQLDWRANLTSDTCMLICGIISDTVYSWGGCSDLPHWYKVDKNGNLLWETKWQMSEADRQGDARRVIEDKNGNYYSGGRMAGTTGLSYLFKLSHTGDTIARYRVNEPIPALASMVKTMSFLNDTTLFIGTGFGADSNNIMDVWWSINLTDTIGNVRISKYEHEILYPMSCIITSDNKIVVQGARTYDNGTYPSEWFTLYKFNTNLEYDSIYTAPRTYDYMCPHPIKSDTIPMPGNCITVNMPEAPKADETMQLKVYPNPANEFVTVEIPEFSVTNTVTGFVTQQQFRPLNGELQLSLINLSGQIVKTEVFDASRRNHVLRVNTLPPGLYVIHLTQKGKFVAQGKVMVVR
ncbi:MAG: T9SS type A sorting domain-containing protein [Bacteroidota bacterium]